MKIALIVYQVMIVFPMIFTLEMKLLLVQLTMIKITLAFIILLIMKQQKIIVTKVVSSGLINKHIRSLYQFQVIQIPMLLQIYQMFQVNKIVRFIIIYKELILIMKLKKIKLRFALLKIHIALVQTLLILLYLNH